MPEEQKPSSEEMKVTDRRSFTSSGDRRIPDLPKSEPRRAVAPEEAASSRNHDGIGFENFARYLAQLALHQMEGERNPATGALEVSLEEARQTIDILAMLKEKTQGNLSAVEKRTLEDLLHHLKVEFTRRANATRR